MKTVISLYFRRRNFYQALREYRIKSYFGKLDSPGSVTDCQNTIANVFNKISENEKY